MSRDVLLRIYYPWETVTWLINREKERCHSLQNDAKSYTYFSFSEGSYSYCCMQKEFDWRNEKHGSMAGSD